MAGWQDKQPAKHCTPDSLDGSHISPRPEGWRAVGAPRSAARRSSPASPVVDRTRRRAVGSLLSHGHQFGSERDGKPLQRGG